MATIGYREETGAGIVRAAVAATFGGRGVAAFGGRFTGTPYLGLG